MAKWIEYADLHEVDQGGPLAGALALLYVDKGVIISDWAGGPPVWDETGRRLAFPLWETTLFKGRFQRIAIIDTKEETITVFAEKFEVLKLERLIGTFIYGFDSALHQEKKVCFDTSIAEVETVKKFRTEERKLFADK